MCSQRGGAVTYQLLLTLPKKTVDPNNEGPPYAREMVLTFPGPSKPGTSKGLYPITKIF